MAISTSSGLSLGLLMLDETFISAPCSEAVSSVLGTVHLGLALACGLGEALLSGKDIVADREGLLRLGVSLDFKLTGLPRWGV